ncbi:unnamed protein product, partial [Ectocarpus sp. 4 AP-2014]
MEAASGSRRTARRRDITKAARREDTTPTLQHTALHWWSNLLFGPPGRSPPAELQSTSNQLRRVGKDFICLLRH